MAGKKWESKGRKSASGRLGAGSHAGLLLRRLKPGFGKVSFSQLNSEYYNFVFCLAHGQIRRKWPQMKPGVFLSPTNQGLVDILGRTAFHYESFHLLMFLESRFPDS